MSKDIEKNKDLLKNPPTEDDEDDEDEEEDEDYNPDQENDSAGSEIDEDDEIEGDNQAGSRKRSKNKSSRQNNVANNDSDEDESKGKLIKIDEDKISLLWSEFCKDDAKKEVPKTETIVVTKQYDFAGETVVVQEEVKVDKSVEKPIIEKTENESSTSSSNLAQPSTARPPIKRGSSGLTSLLDQLKKPKMNTLTKSLHDWNDYKKKENIEEELDQHRRSKNSFIERQAFLDRTDVREFQREKSIRDHERKMREVTKPN